MALIIYPAADWNSFITVAAADVIIGGFVSDNGYLSLDAAGKEAILKQTALQISLCPGITLPAAVTPQLEIAQCYLTTYAMTADMLSFDPNGAAINAESVDVISVSYDTGLKGSAADFPPIVQAILKPYGCGKTGVNGYVGVS